MEVVGECRNEDDDDKDWVLLFEHKPTYTLGRGSTVDHLTFLHSDNPWNIPTLNDDRRRLDQKYRGMDASRLNINLPSSSDDERIMSVEEEVNHILTIHRNHTLSYPPVLAPNGAPVHRVERGGEVTFHGPGQLIIYPLLNLDNNNSSNKNNYNTIYKKDLHWYLRSMEEVVIRTLLRYDIQGERDPAGTGVWVDAGQRKIAAIGVSSSRWITTHGVALNVDVGLRYFDNDIVTPCGIEDRGVTSIARELCGERYGGCGGGDLVRRPTVEEVGQVALESFAEVFGIDVKWGRDIQER
jgi:lipoyl(octanoyl) transferase